MCLYSLFITKLKTFLSRTSIVMKSVKVTGMFLVARSLIPVWQWQTNFSEETDLSPSDILIICSWPTAAICNNEEGNKRYRQLYTDRRRKMMTMMMTMSIHSTTATAEPDMMPTGLSCKRWAAYSTYTQTSLTEQVAQLSQRDRAAGCVSYRAKSGSLELVDNILQTLYVYLQPLWRN